jgi:formylglycine-generating enzyme required for sulfatase activity
VSADGTTLSVEAAGAGMLTYQWRLNGAAIAGGTSSQLSTQGLQSGTYTVVVSNGFASVTSNSIQFSAPVNLGFTLVTGGTLPASSPLGPVPVETFYIGRTEVTWGEWQAVRDWAVANGYADLANVGQGVGDNYPVSHVNWYDVVKWCNARSEREGKTPVYKVEGEVYRTGQSTPEEIPSANGYRLPSEKEWEFAARGGKQTQGYIYSGSNSLDDVGWYNGNSFGSVYQVANKRANELSIFDMSGNVLEWTSDWSPGYVGLYRLHRGGGAAGPWYTYAHDGEVARRGHAPPDQSTEIINILGFRVATSGEYALGITAQPSLSSDGARISVQAGGSGTLTYQWMRDGVVTSGATSSQLSTEGLQSGTYTVVVSNGFSSVTSGNLQYPPSPIGTFALVTGGTLPASSPFGGVPVDTFYIGKTEITWGEWKTVRTWATANGYTGLANVGQGLGDSYPVSHVNWDDAVKWCNARSEKEGKTPVYKAGADVYRTGEVSEPELVSSANGYRLPSGAEWEFAARGGTHSNGYTYSGSNDLGAVGWNAGNSGYAVHEVGKKQANELGIFDMTGNLTEWSGDMAQFTETVLRLEIGSNFNHSGGSYMMSYVPPNLAYYQAGFRVALSSVP